MFYSDRVYYWEKPTSERQLLGYVQFGDEGFNMSFVLDGTKDSTKLQVWSFSNSNVVKPNTIIWHINTDTWWVVANDKVERFENESGFLYKHTLQLNGAIELFNARDLTDCGFYQNKYTINQIVNRLVSLSNFELPLTTNYGNNLNGNEIVDYIKSYENYTLLTAIRELFDGYNCGIKLSFNRDSDDYLTSAVLNVFPKTGNIDRTITTFDDAFANVREIKTMNKDSYGTTVVSNAENIVSSLTKKFPTIGGARFTSDELDINADNAKIRLPSNIFSVEEVKLHFSLHLVVTLGGTSHSFATFNVSDYYSIDNALTVAKQYMSSTYGQFNPTDFESHRVSMREQIRNTGTMTFKNCVRYDPISDQFISTDSSYKVRRVGTFTSSSTYTPNYVVLMDKASGDSVPKVQIPVNTYTNRIIKWERGTDYISGFEWLYHSVALLFKESDLGTTDYVLYSWTQGGQTAQLEISHVGSSNPTIYSFPFQNTSQETFTKNGICVSVNYIPMNDMKVKYDNKGDDNNIQLYNQNGKLTDGSALSKLINSYKTEIESDNITRYTFGYNFSTMPKVGDILTNGNDKYVINNVSLDFYPNEESSGYSGGYFLVGEYTLSKNVATKSLLTNPNTNVRDYGIPQNYNVKRKQLYRDFYEFDFVSDEDSDSEYYLPLEKILNIGSRNAEYGSHVAVIKVEYENACGGNPNASPVIDPQDTWYYQLETTTYLFKKSFYEIVDFKDNNIIGYDSQSMFSGYSIQNILGNYGLKNTPISYVDDNGEIKGISLAFCSSEQVHQIYDSFKDYEQVDSGITAYNLSVFVDSKIYEGVSGTFNGAKDNNDFLIEEETYYKDRIEVPVFEYCCQIDDTNSVEIGDDILDNENAIIIMYSGSIQNLNTTNSISASRVFEDLSVVSSAYSGNQGFDYQYEITTGGVAVRMTIENNDTLRVKFYDSATATLYANADNSSTLLSGVAYSQTQIAKANLIGKDLVIYNNNITNLVYDNGGSATNKQNVMFVIHNAKATNFDNDDLILKINHWRLK